MRRLPLTLVCLILLFAAPASAQVHRWGTEGYNSTQLVPLTVTGLPEAA